MSNLKKQNLFFPSKPNHGNSSSSGDEKVEDRLVAANPLLEAFGNAKTLRNNNSSRFGKWLSLTLSLEGVIIGGRLKQYLLEESRVVNQLPGIHILSNHPVYT